MNIYRGKNEFLPLYTPQYDCYGKFTFILPDAVTALPKYHTCIPIPKRI